VGRWAMQHLCVQRRYVLPRGRVPGTHGRCARHHESIAESCLDRIGCRYPRVAARRRLIDSLGDAQDSHWQGDLLGNCRGLGVERLVRYQHYHLGCGGTCIIAIMAAVGSGGDIDRMCMCCVQLCRPSNLCKSLRVATKMRSRPSRSMPRLHGVVQWMVGWYSGSERCSEL
jgi:hypothetical protein